MVMGDKIPSAPREKKDLFKENLAKIVFEDDNPQKPMVHIDESVFVGLSDPWKDALVVKLLGKSIGFNTMRDKLTNLWKLVAGFQLMDIGNRFFMVKFDHAADREKVMDGGPWMIFDHYLTVQQWSDEFTSPVAKIDNTMVWIRFPGLNLFYYDESILMALAAAVGKPIKVDSNTLDVKRGRFARVCVEINLNKPVIGKVWLRGHWYHVEYEGLHRICTTCGCYGHLTRQCKVAVVQTSSSSSQESQRSPANIAVTAAEKNPPSANGGADNVTDRNQINGPAKVSEQNQESIYGDWLIVKRKSRTSKSNNNNKTAPLSNGKKKLNDQFKNGKNHANGNIESSQNEHAFNSHKATKFPSKNCMATATNKDINRIQPKRQRNDDTPNLDLPHTNSLVKDEINKKKDVPLRVKNGQGPIIHDLGDDINNIDKLQEAYGSRFKLLPQNGELEDINNMEVGVGDLNSQHIDQEMVHETQPLAQNMKT
ncbi:hypothetical protein L195_g042953 [Trifolium pratense]|uniref:CCHC-type domain-containing protein n=1 Tax=Trifolium pratense TaxID=57577 RepID=A0A2K3M7X1_TRIPR|nr:hypothetical protein L195_g042953 [Trifolium pratense]